MSSDAQLKILLLGAPGIFYNDSPFPVKRRRIRALLYYLACQPEGVGRDELILLFWPDEPVEKARRYLREILSRLRAELPEPGMLVVVNDRVALDHERIISDVLDFKAIIKQLGRIIQVDSDSPYPDAIYKKILHAVELWRSPRFLAGANLPSGEGFDRWAEMTSQEMEHGRQLLLERLADHAILCGDLETGIIWLKKALENDELNPDLHYQYFNCLKDLRRISELQSYCSYVRRLFERESQEFPLVLSQFCRSLQSESNISKPRSLYFWPNKLSLQIPYVGRENELRELKHVFQRGGQALILAEAGGGKSRLIHEAYHTFDPAPRLFVIAAKPMESAIPFQPIVDLLRRSINEKEWESLGEVWREQLILLLPELAGMRSNNDQPLPTLPLSEANTLIFEALHQLFLQIATKERVLFFLDDAQWVDEASLQAMAYLTERNFFSQYGLLVIAARQGEESEPLKRFTQLSRTNTVFKTIVLDRLNKDEVALMGQYSLGYEPPQELVLRLMHDTGGNPLFVLETLRAILDVSSNPESIKNFEKLPLATSIQNLVRERLRSLSSKNQQILLAAVVIRNPFDLYMLEEASQFSTEVVVQAVEEFEHLRIIQDSKDKLAPGSYSFSHDKIREVIYKDISSARRRLLHLRIAQALERKYEKGAARFTSVIAYHFESAGEFSTAFYYWNLSAKHAASLYSKPEAYSSFQKADQLLQYQDIEISEDAIYRFYNTWGIFAFDLSDLELARSCFLNMARSGLKRNSALLLGVGLSGMAFIHGSMQNFDQGLKNIDEAITYLSQTTNLREQLEAYNRKGILLMRIGQCTQALDAFRKGLELSEDSTDPEVIISRGKTNGSKTLLNCYMGFPKKAEELAEMVLADFQGHMNVYEVVWIRALIAMADFYLGKYKQAVANATIGIEACRTMQNWWLLSWLQITKAHALIAMGQLDEGWKSVNESLKICTANNFADLLPEVYCVMGDVYRLLELTDLAIDSYRKGALISKEAKPRMDNQYRLGVVLSQKGDNEGGLRLIDEVIESAQKGGMGLIELTAHNARATILYKMGRIDEAIDVFSRTSIAGASRGFITLPLASRVVLAQRAIQSGDYEDALEHVKIMVNTASEISNPWLVLWANKLGLPAMKNQGLDTRQVESAIKELVSQIDKNCQDPMLRPAFLKWQTAMLNFQA
ncbi:MAG: AAA family ATPase [Anaerolineaceae bacterium]|nr:AAA family ATPase [Anaerolineaceae bacterium]